VIVGGGPAGNGVGYLLACAGVNVTVLGFFTSPAGVRSQYSI